MTEQEMQARIQRSRSFIRWSNEDFESDQMRKRPQPPLTKAPAAESIIPLPRNFDALPLEKDFLRILYARRSSRVYTREPISLLTLSFLMWAQQGIKEIRGNRYATLRTVPSGGARHPFELYALVLRGEGVEPGLYHYLPEGHGLELLRAVDPADETLLNEIDASVCGQSWVRKASVIFYYSIVPYRAEWRYAYDAHRVTMMDAGHVSQNLYLACSALGLGTCAIAAVDPDAASALFGLDGVEEFMFYSCPVGSISADNEKDEQAFYAFLKEQA